MRGVTVYNGRWALTHQRLKDVMYSDGRANPMLWFVKDLETNDYLVCGVRTKREALEFVGLDAQR